MRNLNPLGKSCSPHGRDSAARGRGWPLSQAGSIGPHFDVQQSGFMTVALARETIPAESPRTTTAIAVESSGKAPRWAVCLLALSAVLTVVWSLFLVWGGSRLLGMIAAQIP